MTQDTSALFTRLHHWWIIHGKEARTIAIVCLACLAIGAFFINPVQKVGYHLATVETFGVRHGSKRPGVRVDLTLPDGRRVSLTSRAYNGALRKGAEICVLETTGTFRKGWFYELALPSRCAR